MPRGPQPRRRPQARPRSRGRSGFWFFLLGVLVGALVLYAGFGDRSRPDEPPDEKRSSASQTDRGEDKTGAAAGTARARDVRPVQERYEPEAVTEARESEVEVVAEPAPAEGGRVALVIDDLGRSVEDLDTLRDLDVPISYAVLPFEEQTPQVASELRRRGAEILLHLPMEPAGAKDPGPGALRLGMTPEQLRQATLAALQEVPGAVGVNNHMGSGLSADERSMSTILGVIGARGLFFLDSRTSAQSVGYRVAARLGLPAAERQVFLDPDPSPDAIRHQFHRLLGLARTRGAAVAIGHPLPETLAVLAEEVPKAKALGYEFVPVSYLLNQPDAPEEPEE